MTTPLTLVGPATLTAPQMKAALLKKNPAAAPIADGIANRYLTVAKALGLNGGALFAQAMLEADYIRSWWSQEPRRNLCGYGVTGSFKLTDPKNPVTWAYRKVNVQARWYEGYSFGTWGQAMLTHAAHAYAYAFIDNKQFSWEGKTYTIDGVDQRARLIAHRGGARLMTDLNDRWAVNRDKNGNIIPNHYGESITAVHDWIATFPK